AASLASGNLVIAGNAGFTTITLNPTQGVTFSASQGVTLNNTSLTFGAGANNAPVTFNGTTTLVGNNTLTQTNTGGIYFNGKVTELTGGVLSLAITAGGSGYTVGEVVALTGTGSNTGT